MIDSWLIDGSHVVTEGAQDRETLRQWLDQADLMRPVPFWRPYFYSADELPQTVQLYRGGSRELDVLAAGSAGQRTRGSPGATRKRQIEHGGQAVVVTITVPRDDILFCPKAQAEAVLTTAAAGTVDTDDRDEIEKLAALGMANLTAWHEQCLRINLISDDVWQGWVGDEWRE